MENWDDEVRSPQQVFILHAGAGFGLIKDATMLRDKLESFGVSVSIVHLDYTDKFSHVRLINFFYAVLYKFNLLYLYRFFLTRFLNANDAIYVHLENIVYTKLYCPGKHVLIPNQEWFRNDGISLISYMDAIWCKTRLAEHIFNQFSAKTSYLGFATEMNHIPKSSAPKRECFFSRIGRSDLRGIDTLVSAWAKHPEWPDLYLVVHPSRRPETKPLNVHYYDEFVAAEDYFQFASQFSFHIYATETEGFGHAIHESIAMGALLLLTNAPPMNEIFTSDDVIYIEAAYKGYKGLSPLFGVTVEGIEHAVQKALVISTKRQLLIRSSQARLKESEELLTNNLRSRFGKS